MSDAARCHAAVPLRQLRHCWFLWLVNLLLVAAVFWTQRAYTQDGAASNMPFGTFRGKVINSATRQPVGHALVLSTDHRLATFTDDEGRFEFAAPRSASDPGIPLDQRASYLGSVQLMARKPGFLEAGNEGSYPPQSLAEDMTIVLIPESLIVGRVNLPSTNQSDRITVDVYKRQVRDGRPYWVLAAKVVARSNGEFRIANLAPGIYKILTEELLDRDPITFNPRGQQYGYLPSYYPAARDLASASAINLDAGKTVPVELSPVLQPYYSVKIAVTNPDPKSGITVSVAPQGHRGPGYSLEYTGDSSIEGMLPSGTYTVEASMPEGRPTADGSVSITVRDAPLVHASMAVVPRGSIPVNIRDERSEKGRQFFASIRIGRFSRQATADVSLSPADEFDETGLPTLRLPSKPNDNDLVLENVRPGRYWLQVSPFFGYVASAVAGGVDLLRQPLVVGPGGSSPAVEIVVRDDGAAIEGTVEGMPAAPARMRGLFVAGPTPGTASAIVYCIPLPDSAGRFSTAEISAAGTFQFKQLPPGVYRVLAFDRHQDELEYQNAEAMGAYEGQGPVIHLASGQTESVRVPLISAKE